MKKSKEINTYLVSLCRDVLDEAERMAKKHTEALDILKELREILEVPKGVSITEQARCIMKATEEDAHGS